MSACSPRVCGTNNINTYATVNACKCRAKNVNWGVDHFLGCVELFLLSQHAERSRQLSQLCRAARRYSRHNCELSQPPACRFTPTSTSRPPVSACDKLLTTATGRLTLRQYSSIAHQPVGKAGDNLTAERNGSSPVSSSLVYNVTLVKIEKLRRARSRICTAQAERSRRFSTD